MPGASNCTVKFYLRVRPVAFTGTDLWVGMTMYRGGLLNEALPPGPEKEEWGPDISAGVSQVWVELFLLRLLGFPVQICPGCFERAELSFCYVATERPNGRRNL